LPVPILVQNDHLQIWQLLTALLAFLELKHSHLHIVSILNIKAEKTQQHFNASLFVTIWVAVIGSFLTIDARMGRVMKRGVLQNTGPCLQAHYSSLGPARGLECEGVFEYRRKTHSALIRHIIFVFNSTRLVSPTIQTLFHLTSRI
jgi:hypothetical protein